MVAVDAQSFEACPHSQPVTFTAESLVHMMPHLVVSESKKRARWCVPGGVCQVVCARWCVPGGECQVVCARWCVPGGVCQVVCARWCVPGGVCQVVCKRKKCACGEWHVVAWGKGGLKKAGAAAWRGRGGAKKGAAAAWRGRGGGEEGSSGGMADGGQRGKESRCWGKEREGKQLLGPRELWTPCCFGFIAGFGFCCGLFRGSAGLKHGCGLWSFVQALGSVVGFGVEYGLQGFATWPLSLRMTTNARGTAAIWISHPCIKQTGPAKHATNKSDQLSMQQANRTRHRYKAQAAR
eukprot:196142-Chlamydomonas_euryale.AAC.3